MSKNKDSTITLTGVVQEVLPSTTFRVKLDEFNSVVLAHISGKMRTNNINILAGDKVDMEFSVYDMTRGRIVFRHK